MMKTDRKSLSTHLKTRHPFTLTVTSGKGGVGKTCISVNLAIALQKHGISTLLVDLDQGLANVDVLLRLCPGNTLHSYLDEQSSLEDCVQKGPEGLRFIANRSGKEGSRILGLKELNGIIHDLARIDCPPEVILLDTGAGISETVLSCSAMSDETILVTTPEPTAITDAYAMVKAIHRKRSSAVVHLLPNRVRSIEEAHKTTNKLTSVAKKFLDFDLCNFGWIQEDDMVQQSVQKQVPLLLESPGCPASRNIRFLAAQMSSTIRKHQVLNND